MVAEEEEDGRGEARKKNTKPLGTAAWGNWKEISQPKREERREKGTQERTFAMFGGCYVLKSGLAGMGEGGGVASVRE